MGSDWMDMIIVYYVICVVFGSKTVFFVILLIFDASCAKKL